MVIRRGRTPKPCGSFDDSWRRIALYASRPERAEMIERATNLYDLFVSTELDGQEKKAIFTSLNRNFTLKYVPLMTVQEIACRTTEALIDKLKVDATTQKMLQEAILIARSYQTDKKGLRKALKPYAHYLMITACAESPQERLTQNIAALLTRHISHFDFYCLEYFLDIALRFDLISEIQKRKETTAQ